MRKKLCMFLAAALVAALLCGCNRPRQRYETSYMDVFDTVTTITGYAENFSAFKETAEEIHSELQKYHRLFDIYNDYPGQTNLKTVNDCAAKEPVSVEPEVMALLLFCKEVEQATGGTVNAAMGSVLNLWHESREAGLADPDHATLPEQAALEAAAAHTDFSGVILDEAAGTVYFADPALRLDVGAVAKGYAVEQVCAQLPEGYLVSVGGNVRARGSKADGSPWTVGLQSPDGSGYLRTVAVAGDTSVVTSGDYQRYYTVDGVKYHHIIDPATLMPGDRWQAVSVICESSAVADALSTALFLMDQAQGQQLLEKFDAQALWLDEAGTLYESPGWPEQEEIS